MVAAACLPVGRVAAQELSTVVLPSADEVVEALAQGEIDFEQYEVLMELINSGITLENTYLLDAIPNLADFVTAQGTDTSGLEANQLAPFWNVSHRPGLRRVFKHQYYSTLAEKARERYRSSLEYQVDRNWSGSIQIRKELSGRERLTQRGVCYNSDSGTIRGVAIGTYRIRYGLGTVVGFRGKSLSYSRRLDGESLLCPDYGGFNGLEAELRFGQTQARGMISYNRDSAHAVATTAATLRQDKGLWSEAITVGVSSVSNRSDAATAADLKAAVTVSRKFDRGAMTLEYCAQTGSKTDFGTMVLEGSDRSSLGTVQYAVWRYGKRYIDLSGGGKAAAISHTSQLDEVDFSMSDKWSGQYGLLGKGSARITSNVTLTGALLAAARSKDSTLVQIRPGVEWSSAHNWRWTVDYLQTNKRKTEDTASVELSDRKIRLAGRYMRNGVEAHWNVAHSVSTTHGDFVTLFGSVKVSDQGGQECELWSNLGRLERGKVDYWYGYFRTVQPILERVDLAVKVSHRFDRSSSQPHETAVSLEAIAEL
jgi:hypothetical protein